MKATAPPTVDRADLAHRLRVLEDAIGAVWRDFAAVLPLHDVDVLLGVVARLRAIRHHVEAVDQGDVGA